MKRVALTLCLLLLWTCPVWAQGQLIAGNRTVAGTINAGLTTGTATAYVLTLNPALPAYVPDQQFAMRIHLTNTGAATLAVNAAGAKTMKKWQTGSLVDLASGDLVAGMTVVAYYDGTVMQVLTLGTAAGGGGPGGGVPTSRLLNTTAPLTGGGDLTTDRTLSCPSCVTSASALGSGLPLVGAGGQGIGLGTKSGNTTKLVTMDASTPAVNDCAKFDGAGNLTTAGAACGAGAAGTGDISDVGSCTGPACFTTASPSGQLTFAPGTAPATPALNKAVLYVDSTSKNLAVKDDAGLVKHGVQTKAATAGQFLTAIADDGTVALAAPSKADIGLNNVDNTSDSTKWAATAIISNKQIDGRVVQCSAVANVITANADVTDTCYNYSLTATTTIANPTGANIRDMQRLEYVFKTAGPVTLAWGSNITAECGIPLPTSTTGDSVTYNHILLRYSTTSSKWCILATTKSPLRSVTTLTSSTTYTCPPGTSEQCQMQMTGAAGTITMGIGTGAPDDGQYLLFSLMCTNAQALSWPGATFIASRGIPLPTSCPASTSAWLAVGLRYSSALGKWQILASSEP